MPTQWKTLNLRRRNGSGRAVPELSRACLIRLIDFPELPLRTRTSEVVKAGGSALVVRTELPVGDRLVTVAYKRVHRKSRLKRLVGTFRKRRALHTWRMGHEFLHRGINTARPLAVILPKTRRPGRAAYYVTEWISHAANLHAFCQSVDNTHPHPRLNRTAAAAGSLGGLIGRMHCQEIGHRDLKPGNILIRERDGGIETFIIDLDGATLRRRLSLGRRLQDLSRLAAGVAGFRCVNNSARLRFLRAWLKAHSTAKLQWKKCWREIARAVCRRHIDKLSRAA